MIYNEVIGMIIGVIIGIIIIIPAWPVFAWILAHFDIFFTFVEEGEAKAVVRGKKFHKILFSKKDSKLLYNQKMVNKYNEWVKEQNIEKEKEEKTLLYEVETGEIIKDPGSHILGVEKTNGRLKYWEKKLGIYWVGFWPFFKIYEYDFSWSSIKMAENAESQILFHPDETLKSIFIKDAVYAHLLESAETTEGELMAAKLKYILTIRVVNPEKALFRVHRWLDAILELTGPQVRTLISQKTYSELNQVTDEDFASEIQKVEAEMHRRYGIEFVNAKIHSVDPGSEQAVEYRKALSAEAVAEMNAKAQIKAAEGEAAVVQLTGEAEANVIQAKGKANALALEAQAKVLKEPGGDQALVLERARAIAGGKSTNLVISDGILETASRIITKSFQKK